MNRLDGKVAIVFGAGPNIGGTIAHFLVREGARVAVADIDGQAASGNRAFLGARGYEALALSGNAIREDDVARIVGIRSSDSGGSTASSHGRQGALVVGARYATGRLERGGAELSHRRYADHQARRQGDDRGRRARQRHPSSVHGRAFRPARRCGLLRRQGGIAQFRPLRRHDLAHHQIRVNTITPCAMEHQLWTHMREEIADEKFVLRKDRPHYSRDDFLKSIPLERFRARPIWPGRRYSCVR